MDGLVNTHEVPASEEPKNTSVAMLGPSACPPVRLSTRRPVLPLPRLLRHLPNRPPVEKPTASDYITWESFKGETDDSCKWSNPYNQQVGNLKESFRKLFFWTGAWNDTVDRVVKFEMNPWFASAVWKLRNAPCLETCEVEIDKALLGLLLSGSKLTSLNLAIMMQDTKLVQRMIGKCPAPNGEMHRPLVDPQRAIDFLNIVTDDPRKITGVLFTPLHLATWTTCSIMGMLMNKGVDINEPNWFLETPLELAAQEENAKTVDCLLEFGTKEEYVPQRYGPMKYKTEMPLHVLASKWHQRYDVTSLVKYVGGSKHTDINAVDESGLSALYVATLCCNTEFVIALLEHFKDRIRLNEECDKDHGPPIQIAFEGGDDFKDIERALMECDSVKSYMDNLYRDRQVYVDAANAILVGAALIASVTFASWLQPPLNYTSYSGEGYSSSIPTPATSDLNYVDVEHNIPLRAFWVFNALSFYFAIGSVVCGARSVLPRRHLFIKKTVEKLRTNLLVTSIFLACSMLFVIIAFAIAGTIVLTPSLKYQWYMIVPTLVGGVVCIISLVFMVKNMREIFSDKRGKSEQFNSTKGDTYYNAYLKKKGYKLQCPPFHGRGLR